MDTLREAEQCGPTAVQTPNILTFLDNQSNRLDILGDSVHLLAEKLNPVLNPSISKPQDINERRPTGEKSACAELVKSNVVRTETITEEVRAIIERLDL